MKEKEGLGSGYKYNIQSFTEYMRHARSTALYLDTTRAPAISGLMYSTLGIVSELSEFLHAADTYRKKIIAKPYIDVIKEAGDVLWYAANIFQDIGINSWEPELVCSLGMIGDIPQYDGLSRWSMGHAGQIAGAVKKIYRDQPIDTLKEFPIAIHNEDSRALIEQSLQAIVFHVIDMASLANGQADMIDTFRFIMNVNIEKLYSRRDRGMLHGSGDDR